MPEILKETTVWDTSFEVPNHTYLIDDRGYILAYAKQGSNQITKLKGTIRLDKRRRSFVKSNHPALGALIGKKIPIKTNTRVFRVNSNDRQYTVTVENDRYTCTCTGYTYRGKCKHITAVMETIL